jgi:hypothetical protein
MPSEAETPDLALIEATARKINPGRSEDHIKSVALDALSIIRALSAVRSEPVAWQRRLMNPTESLPGSPAGTWGAWHECTPEQASFAMEHGGVDGFGDKLRAEVRDLYTSPVQTREDGIREALEAAKERFAQIECATLNQTIDTPALLSEYRVQVARAGFLEVSRALSQPEPKGDKT